MKTSFYTRGHKDGTASIYIRINEGRGSQHRFKTGHQLNKSSSWNKKTQSVRTNSFEPFDLINLQLSKLKAYINNESVKAKSESTYRNIVFFKDLVESFQFTEGNVKKDYKVFTIEQLFIKFIEEANSLPIGYGGKKLQKSTLATYDGTIRLLSHLHMSRTPLIEVDMNWYYEFLSKAEYGGKNNTPLSLNYIGKNVKNIKRVLRYAEDNGLSVNPAYKSRGFKVRQETASDIYLTEDELRSIRELKLVGEHHSLELTRDLFMIGAYSGLRVSDYNRLTKDNIHKYDGSDMFEVRCKKTNSLVIVPIHPVVKCILVKYENSLPPSQNEQLINRNLKTLGRLCGMDDGVTLKTTKGGRMTSCMRPKYEMIKTHTARRSFCTNAYLSKMDTLDIMALSGHKTESNFLKYIKVTGRERAKRIAEHKFFQ